MGISRLEMKGPCHYHLIAMAAGLQPIFAPPDEKDRIVDALRATSEFSGIGILDYCILDDHLHLLVHAGGYSKVPEEELLRRVGILNGLVKTWELRGKWEVLRKHGQETPVEEEAEALRRRMGRISAFMKTFRMRISIDYNKRHGISGMLWTGKFTGLPIGEGLPLLAVSLYIGANSCRAGLARRPEEYPWSGIGAAAAGSKGAAEGIFRARACDAGPGGPEGAVARQIAQYEEAFRPGVPLGRLLLRRDSCFTFGGAIGTRAFLEKVLSENRIFFGKNSRTAPREMPFWGEAMGGEILMLRTPPKRTRLF